MSRSTGTRFSISISPTVFRTQHFSGPRRHPATEPCESPVPHCRRPPAVCPEHTDQRSPNTRAVIWSCVISPCSQTTCSLQYGCVRPNHRLDDLGLFARTESTIQNRTGDEVYKLVLYDFDEANRYQLNVGIGGELGRFGPTTSDLNKPAGSAGFSPRVSVDCQPVELPRNRSHNHAPYPSLQSSTAGRAQLFRAEVHERGGEDSYRYRTLRSFAGT